MAWLIRLFSFICLIGLARPSIAFGDGPAFAGSEFEQTLEAKRQKAKIPGVAISIVHQGKVIYQRGFGLRNVKENLPVTPDTLFAIGSTSKAFTAVGIGILVNEGKLEWTTPVREIIPEFRLMDEVATRLATPIDLLSHRIGLPRHDLVWYGSDLTRTQIMSVLRHLQPSKTFREAWQYNNLLYMVAGVVAERASGAPSWEAFTRDRILHPLGMQRTNFSVADMAQDADHSRPYIALESLPEAVEVPFRSIDAVGPAGSINSSVAEMSRWLIAQLSGGVIDGQQVLPAEAIATTHQSHMVMPPRSSPELSPEFSDMNYGLGWFNYQYRDQLVVTHNGGIDGFITNIALLPEHELGIIVVSNGAGTDFPGMATNSAIDHWLGVTGKDWYHKGSPESGSDPQTSGPTVVPLQRPAEDYVGAYRHPAYGTATVVLEDGKLILAFRDLLRAQLLHVGHGVFVIEGLRSDLDGDKAVFDTGFDGSITGIRVKLEVTVDPQQFKKVLAVD